MGNHMVLVFWITLVVTDMLENGKMVKGMVKEEIRGILGITMLGNGVMGRCVREHFTIKMER